MGNWLEIAVEALVRETTNELCGDRHLETAMKHSLAPQSTQQNALVGSLQPSQAPAKESKNFN